MSPKAVSHGELLALCDLVCVTWAVAIAGIIRFGMDPQSLGVGPVQAPYALLGLALDAAWWAVLGIGGSRSRRLWGSGPEEYKQAVRSSLWLFGAIAVASYTFQIDTARGYVAAALPLGIASLLFGRWCLRAALVRDRAAGRNLHRVLLVGSAESVEHLYGQLSAHPEAGYRPVALWASDLGGTLGPVTDVLRLPIAGRGGNVDDILRAVAEFDVDTVAVSGGAALSPQALRSLGWALSSQEIGMILAPALTDVAGPRIHMQPAAGLPLVHVTTPKLEGWKAVAKRGIDAVSSTLILAALAVPMLVVAIMVKADSPGPAIFRQTRIGRAGEPFQMLKFRSMVVDADARLRELAHRNEGSGPLFKLKEDPRITRLGRFLRRYSIDELPQLFNVLAGDMSLIGPRPPLRREVEKYDEAAHRRLLVKPGMTGLWQVSGRSDLSWDESIRLDLYYVENWSMLQDAMILLRTARAVMGRGGAY